MTTVRDLIQDSHEDIGAIAAGEALSADMAASGLRELNRMLSSWANEELMVYTKDRLNFSLVGATQSYTIGVGGTWSTPYPVRPGQIDLVSVLFNGVEIPIEILNDEQWRDISVKTTSSTFPLQIWANGNYPLDVLYFWPIPTTPSTVYMTVWNNIGAFADVNQTVALPQGYEDAIVKNLALRLSPKFGIQPSPVLAQMAATAKSRIKEMNWEPTYRTVDSALAGNFNNVGQRSRGYVVD